MDTGAESNILGLEALEQVLQVSKEEITPLGYNLSLRGTTGLRNNAILGRVTVSLSFLLEASQKNAEFDQHHWVSSKVTFLVADSRDPFHADALCVSALQSSPQIVSNVLGCSK